ncbi:MAG: acylneuraminate cytidylyltransferase family protein [Deltaproteobacteria bacterium]|nr:acylneuraminate cytidylyltransferase family protein [Deltaproteobacteria bacterium]
MRVLGFIPARSGSKGVPDKNIKTICNVPLLIYSVWVAQQSQSFADIIVSTDSEAYLSLGASLGIRTDYLRPRELALDTSQTIDAVLDVLKWYRSKGAEFDAVMILQPTAPFRRPEHINKAIQLMQAHPDASCVTGVVRLGDTHPARIKKLVDGKWLEDFCCVHEPEHSRRQDLQPPAFLRNGTIYLTKTTTIENERLIRGKKIIGMEMPEANSVNVDNHLDFLVAEASLGYPAFKDDLSFLGELLSKYKAPLKTSHL